MALDGIMLHALCGQLQQDITGARIEKVMQPDKDTLILALRTQTGNCRLICCAHADAARLHLTENALPNPETPPMFCMLLRKHLTGGRIREVIHHGMERIAEIAVEVHTELGDRVLRRLIIEIMGRHSNIILVNESGVIMDSLKRVGEHISRMRQVLPGLPYTLPPSQGKQDLLTLTDDGIVSALTHTSAVKAVTDAFTGICRSSAMQLCYEAFGEKEHELTSPEDKQRLADRLIALRERLQAQEFSPYLLFRDSEPMDFFAYEHTLYPQLTKAEDFHRMLDLFYEQKEQARRIQSSSKDMRDKLNHLIAKAYKKLSVQEESLARCSDAEHYRNCGDAIMTECYKIHRGMTVCLLTDYTQDPPQEMEVVLQPELSPSDNAQTYYKKYAKFKRSAVIIEEQIVQIKQELDYLEGQLENIDKCTTLPELEEVRSELARFGYVSKKGKKTGNKPQPSQPMRFTSRNGIDIYVGKNNAQNDLLTASAVSENMWLHVKDIHGSHVIIRKKGDIPDETLYDAAMLAAYYSKARESSNVPVDYTRKKYVKKPSGAKPGMVIYTDQKTIYVTPDRDHIRKLSIKE